jgi:hypothetical protein
MLYLQRQKPAMLVLQRDFDTLTELCDPSLPM